MNSCSKPEMINDVRKRLVMAMKKDPKGKSNAEIAKIAKAQAPGIVELNIAQAREEEFADEVDRAAIPKLEGTEKDIYDKLNGKLVFQYRKPGSSKGGKVITEPILGLKVNGVSTTIKVDGKTFTFKKSSNVSEPFANGNESTVIAKDIGKATEELLIITPQKKSSLFNQETTTPSGKFDKELDKKLRKILKELYPEINLEYTTEQITHAADKLNQEQADNTVKVGLKVVEALNELGTAKPSKHGGASQPVLSTIRVSKEASIRKKLAAKDVSKEQIDFVFEYMKQNGISEISSTALAEKVLIGLSTAVEVSTAADHILVPAEEKPFIDTIEEVVSLIGIPSLADNKFLQDWVSNNGKSEHKTEIEDAISTEFGLTYNVSKTIIKKVNAPRTTKDYAKEYIKKRDTQYYKDLTVPGGTNYKEMEIATPGIIAPRRGHADFATDKGIGWYRVDDTINDNVTSDVGLNNTGFADMFEDLDRKQDAIDPENKTLRVLEMQSDMFQKMKDQVLDSPLPYKVASEFIKLFEADTSIGEKSDKQVIRNAVSAIESSRLGMMPKEANDNLKFYAKHLGYKGELVTVVTDKNLNKSFLQILNTDNKWVKFFIQSIVQDAAKNGYKKIKFPAGETAAKVEGHESIAEQINDLNIKIKDKESEIEDLLADPRDGDDAKIKQRRDSIKSLQKEKQNLKAQGIEKLAPIESFYQVRVRNTLIKTYGKDNVITTKDEHGNEWFEVSLDTKRDTSAIMLQKDSDNQIKGQADIEAKTVLINSLLQSQDTLPHEYAHHYIAMFRDAPIVQEGIKKWGSEEKLVQAIGEQVVKQKGEAYGWWNRFTKWLQNKFDKLSTKDKEELRNLLTDAFLTNKDLANTSPEIPTEPVKAQTKSEGKSTPVETKKAPKSPSAQELHEAELAEIDAEIKGKENIELGSTKESANVKWKDANRIEDEVHGNIEGMQNLMEELHELGGGKASDSHLKYLKELLGQMSPDFFENMKTHIFTEAKKSEGIALAKSIKVAVSTKPNIANNQMSDAEIYVHEVVHSMIMFALRQDTPKSRKIKRQLEHMVDAAQEGTQWQDFLPADSINKEVEEKEAKEMYDYIFNSENSVEELIAHTLTNPIVMAHMKEVTIKEVDDAKTLWDRIMNGFTTLMEIVSGEYSFKDRSNDVYEQALALSFKLAETNKRAVRDRNNKVNLVMRLWEGFQKYNVKSGELIEEVWDSYVDKGTYSKPPKEGFARAKWMAGALIKMISNQHYRKSMELILSGFGMPPQGDIQSILSDFFKGDNLTETVDMLALLSDKVDTAKNILITATAELIHAGFKRKLTNDEESALTRVLIDTDMSSIADQFTSKTLSKLVSSDAEIDRRISRVKHKLKGLDDKRYNWNTTQGSSLGYFMATGKGHLAQSINATNIAEGVNSSKRTKANPKVVKALDELATLTALKYTSAKDRELISGLLKDNRKGIENVMNTHKEFKAESARTVFANSKHNMMKGYSKETFDDKISMVVAPVSEADELAKDGYEKKMDLPNNKYDTKGVPMAMYIAESYEIGEWYRSATRLTGIQSRGTTLKQIAMSSKTDGETNSIAMSKAEGLKEKMEFKRRALVKKIEAGEVSFDDFDYGLMPVLDEDGYVTDYRYVMTKENKDKILKKDNRISTVMSHSFGHTLDKAETKTQNEKVLDVLLQDMTENYVENSTIGKNQKQYIHISKGSSNPEIQELYKVLPLVFKRAMELEESKGLAVRADLLHSYFGYRHISLAGNKYVQAITPRIMQKLLKIAEHMWMELIKISKVDILIKMPIVMIGNFISNFMYAVMTGTDPITLINEYVESSRAVSDYFKRHKELTALRLAKKTGNIEGRDLNKIKTLERQLAESSIAELAELGIYQSIVEDMEHQDIESTNKVKKQLVNELNKAPKFVQQGMEVLYLTENTAYHKIMNGLLTKSDLVARDIENRKLKIIQKKQADGKMHLPKWYVSQKSGRDKLKSYKYEQETRVLRGNERKEFMALADKQRHSMVLNTFINYNKPSGRIEEYLNKMGFIMFTKYAKRIQRVIAETGAKNPLNVAMILLSEELLFGDIETIYDQQLLTKSWYSLGLGGGDMIPGTNPFDRLMEIIEPPLVQLIKDPL